MSTGDLILNLYPEKTIAFEDLATRFADPLRAGLLTLMADVWGQGGVLDSAPGITSASALLTLDDERFAYTPEGYRVHLDPAADGFFDLPFQDTGATTYTIGVASSEVPAEAELGGDGVPRWSHTEEAVGRVLTPASISVVGDTLEIVMTSVLAAGEKWASTSYDRPVRVWYEAADGTPATHTSEAVYDGVMVRTAGAVYKVVVPHHFGQGTPSTTAARYRVLLRGLTPADPTLAASGTFTDTHVLLGTVAGGGSGAHSTTSVRIIVALGDLAADFYGHPTLVHPTVVASIESVVKDEPSVITVQARLPDGTAYEEVVAFEVRVYDFAYKDHVETDAIFGLGFTEFVGIQGVTTGTLVSGDTDYDHVLDDGSSIRTYKTRTALMLSNASGVLVFTAGSQGGAGSGDDQTAYVRVQPVVYRDETGDDDPPADGYPYTPSGPTVRKFLYKYGV